MGGLGLEVRNDLCGMKLCRQRCWAAVQDVSPGTSPECGRRSCWVERLNVIWEGPVGWGLGRVGLDRILEVGWGAGRVARLGQGMWVWVPVEAKRWCWSTWNWRCRQL